MLDKAVVDEAVVARPTGPLRGFVAEFHGYRQRDVLPARHLGLPSPHLTLILTLDEPLCVARHVDPAQTSGRYRTLIGGLHTTPAVIVHDGAQSGIQLQLDPLAARALLGRPAGALAGIDVDLDDVVGRAAGAVQERLQAATSWAQRFALLERELGRWVARDTTVPGPPPEVRRAWTLLRRSGGAAAVAAIARDVGWSERHLARQFRIETGLTPKAAARVIRFDRARRRLQRGGPVGGGAGGAGARGADLAAACGYADQSHLIREFVAFTGLPPTAWLAAEVGNVQVPRPPDGGRSSA